jgi:hypothetical protein
VYYEEGLIWPDGTNIVPADTLPPKACSYDSEESTSLLITVLVYTICLLLVVGAIFYTLKNQIYSEPEPLNEIVKNEVSDTLARIVVVIEAL